MAILNVLLVATGQIQKRLGRFAAVGAVVGLGFEHGALLRHYKVGATQWLRLPTKAFGPSFLPDRNDYSPTERSND